MNWLPMSDRKGLPSIRVIYQDIDYAMGLFFCRMSVSCYDERIDFDRGQSDVIVLSTHWGDPQASTIAHEHRHFQQHYSLSLPQIGEVKPVDGLGEWSEQIKRFYRSQMWEMDALLYSMRVHPDDVSRQHFEDVL